MDCWGSSYSNCVPWTSTRTYRRALVCIIALTLCCLFSALFLAPRQLGFSHLSTDLLDGIFDLVSTRGTFTGFGGDNSNASTLDSSMLRYNASRFAPDVFRGSHVISLPHRTDRRNSMERLRQALSVNWTYVDAVGAGNALVSQIMNHVRSSREERIANSEAQQFIWPTSLVSSSALSSKPISPAGSDLWLLDQGTVLSGINDTSPEPRPLTCATHNLVDGPSYDDAVPPYMQLTPAKIACWYSHVQVLRRIAEDPQREISPDITLILEDDVDMEKDIRVRLSALLDHIPSNWDMLFLGAFLVITRCSDWDH